MMENSWNSYPKVYALGHPATKDIFSGEVLVEEKIDGSQFSFGVIDGVLRTRSKSCEPPDGRMFDLAVSAAEELSGVLRPGWTYRAEYLKTPKQNTLSYNRVPENNIILFDIASGYENYISREEKEQEAERIGLEIVPCMFKGLCGVSDLEGFLQRDSILGGQTVEGIVIKNYSIFDQHKKPVMGKMVRTDFREKNANTHKSNPGVLEVLKDELCTEARWIKAVQHMEERGKLEHSPRDIGMLVKEIQEDVAEEEKEYIKDKLFKDAWPGIKKSLARGFPEWYKEKLIEDTFTEDVNKNSGDS